jgi:hypothetical protein
MLLYGTRPATYVQVIGVTARKRPIRYEVRRSFENADPISD